MINLHRIFLSIPTRSFLESWAINAIVIGKCHHPSQQKLDIYKRIAGIETIKERVACMAFIMPEALMP